jgi:HAD superfamily hydrolase (TIGR01509 family)
MTAQVPVAAVTFDAGQTLVELDTRMLADRLAERGVTVGDAALEVAVPAAWQIYNQLVASGRATHTGGGWHALMTALLAGAGVTTVEPLVDWLWTQQPTRNLWRRPVPGMLALVDDLRRSGIAVGVISNSEGRLAELFAEIGWSDRFPVIADSGRLGIEKPDPRIFQWTLDRLAAAPEATVHVGDSWAADVVGARAAGLRAIWFGPQAVAGADHDVAVCADAGAVRAALSRWGVRLA